MELKKIIVNQVEHIQTYIPEDVQCIARGDEKGKRVE